MVTAEHSQQLKVLSQHPLSWLFYGFVGMLLIHALLLQLLPTPAEMPLPLQQQLKQQDADIEEIQAALESLKAKKTLADI